MTVRTGLIEAFGWELDPAAWMTHAACVGKPAELFFPGRGESLGPARTICGTCPVRFDCLDYALCWRIEHGVWGGLSERERRRFINPPLPRRLPRKAGCSDHCECDGCRQARLRHRRRLVS